VCLGSPRAPTGRSSSSRVRRPSCSCFRVGCGETARRRQGAAGAGEAAPGEGRTWRHTGPRRVRVVREGAARRSSRGRVRLLEASLGRRRDTPGATGALGGTRPRGTARRSARGSTGGARHLAPRPRRAVRGGIVAEGTRTPRRGVRDLRRPRGGAGIRLCAQQPRGRPTAAGAVAAHRARRLLLHQGGRGRSDDPDIYFNLGYAYWFERDAQAPSIGCARPCGAVRSTPTPTSCWPRPSPPRGRASRPPASASWRAGSRRGTRTGSGGATPSTTCRAASSVSVPR